MFLRLPRFSEGGFAVAAVRAHVTPADYFSPFFVPLLKEHTFTRHAQASWKVRTT